VPVVTLGDVVLGQPPKTRKISSYRRIWLAAPLILGQMVAARTYDGVVPMS
jgi:hypothetical protein